MIYISCSAFTNDQGEFKLSSVYCISDHDAYLITRETNWAVTKLPFTLEKLRHVTGTQHYSIEPIIYSPIRVLEGDESAASFLTHVAARLSTLDTEDFHKKLFRILCEIGSEA